MFRWATPGDAPSLPAHTRRVVAAVRAGRGGGLFPPVVCGGPGGVARAARELAGDRDAALIAAALARPAFAPLVTAIEKLGAWCAAAARRHAAHVSPRLLAVDNAALFGPVIRDGFVACAASAPLDDTALDNTALRFRSAASPGAAGLVDAMFEGARRTLARFLRRLARDLDDTLGAAGVRGPVRTLAVAPDETHNGRERVIRVAFRAGGAWAYKPRPATGEQMFVAAADSVFARLNALPPASGDAQLPTLRIVPGSGRDRRAYSWQEWIEKPRQWGTIRRSRRHGLALAACRLAPRDAERFWHRAGALAAACFAFGATDLMTGNLVVGRRRATREPLAYPVDLEIFFHPVTHLTDTGLVNDARDGGNHHVGFERRPRWCTVGGPLAGFVAQRDGLQLRRRTAAWARCEASSVVADTRGRVGFGAYAAAFVRGMFDLWTKLVCERDTLVPLLARAARHAFVRVLIRPTETYGDELTRRLLGEHGGARLALSPEEHAQLAGFDVPYFFCRATGGPLRWIAPATGAHRIAGDQPAAVRRPPSAAIRARERFTLLELGVALRDAIAYVVRDLPRRAWRDDRRGVRIAVDGPGRGSVAFDWPRADRRLTYRWRGATISLDVAALRGGPS